MIFSDLSEDLILEIICKLKYNSLKVLLTGRIINIFYYNRNLILKRIINSYNLLYAGKDYRIIIKFMMKNSKLDLDELERAIRHWEIDTVKFLVKNGVDVNGGTFLTPLNWAIIHDRIEIVEFLINSGSKLNDIVFNNIQDTPLYVAADYDRLDILKLLLEKGANVNAENGDAINIAVYNLHFEVIKLLIKNGADINDIANGLLQNIKRNCQDDVIQKLIDYGINFDSIQN